MTDRQFEKCVQNKIPIYQIWIQGSKFRKKKVKYDEFKYGGVAWINENIPYDCELCCDFMYASEDKLESCKCKLYNYLERQQLQIIKQAEKELQILQILKGELK